MKTNSSYKRYKSWLWHVFRYRPLLIPAFFLIVLMLGNPVRSITSASVSLNSNGVIEYPEPDPYSPNLAVISWTQNDWSEDMAGAASSYATLDYDNLSPQGNPTIRLGPDYTTSHGGEGTREVDCNNDWTIGRGKAGDHVVWKCWVKTDSYPNSGYWTGARIGCDFHARVYDHDTETWHIDILDTFYPQYIYTGGTYYSYNPNGNFPQVPISTFQIPWGTDWTLLVLDFYVPTAYYTTNCLGHTFDPVQIQASSIWIDAREIEDNAYAYFGDAEWYINP